MENILLFFGGKSYEHDISIVTASQIMKKTRLSDYKLIPVYISKNNKFYYYKNKNFSLSDFVNFNDEKLTKLFREVVLVSGENGKLFFKSLFGLKEAFSVNLAINACHGGDGENGSLSVFFEKHGIFMSSGSSEGLAISMNKILFKNLMKGLKIPVVNGFVLNKDSYKKDDEILIKKLKKLKFPLILKPCNGGSSIGLFIVKNIDEFDEKLLGAFEFDDDVIIEKFISGAREFNVAILGNKQNFQISELDEPVKVSEVLSFEDKYLSGSKNIKGTKTGAMSSLKRNFPADVSIDVSNKIKQIAIDVFKSLNLYGVVRIDFLYDEKNSKIYVLEVNAVPGSLAFYFFSRGKILINDFVLKLIEIAKNNKNKNQNFNFEYITKVLG